MAAEKNFENKIKGFLKDHGCWFLKYWGGAAYTKSGIPDILACCNGKFLGIEVKAKNGKPSELQLYNLKKIDEAGMFWTGIQTLIIDVLYCFPSYFSILSYSLNNSSVKSFRISNVCKTASSTLPLHIKM